VMLLEHLGENAAAQRLMQAYQRQQWDSAPDNGALALRFTTSEASP